LTLAIEVTLGSHNPISCKSPRGREFRLPGLDGCRVGIELEHRTRRSPSIGVASKVWDIRPVTQTSGCVTRQINTMF